MLACTCFAAELKSLSDCTRANSGALSYDDCLRRFDGVLSHFCNTGSPRDRLRAANVLCTLLRAEANVTQDLDPRVCELLERVASDVEQAAPQWSYEIELERQHRVGREIARSLFANSPWPATKSRLNKDCDLCIEFVSTPEAVPGQGIYGPGVFGPRGGAPISTRKYTGLGQPGTDLEICLRWSFERGIRFYLALPYLFVHEYSATVIAMDHRNEPFNDGWMLHVAASHLELLWTKSPRPIGLVWGQHDVFYASLHRELNGVNQRTCNRTRQLGDWLAADSNAAVRQKFNEFTLELAGFVPFGTRDKYWPSRFLNSLGDAFDTDPRGLRDKMVSTNSAGQLWAIL